MQRETFCTNFGKCGGCSHLDIPYEAQLQQKEAALSLLLKPVIRNVPIWERIIPSPADTGYRNKMEYSFGDEQKDGPLTLGLHQKRSFYNVLNAGDCLLAHPDFGVIVKLSREYFSSLGVSYFHKRSHKGYLRHLLLRRGAHTGELMIDLVTSNQYPFLNGSGDLKKLNVLNSLNSSNNVDNLDNEYSSEKAGDDSGYEFKDKEDNKCINISVSGSINKSINGSKNKSINGSNNESNNGGNRGSINGEEELLRGWRDSILELSDKGMLEGKIVGILHTINSSLSDAIKEDFTETLYGQDYFYDEILGLRFRITPFSFFQTNSLGAERLYQKVREYTEIAWKEKFENKQSENKQSENKQSENNMDFHTFPGERDAGSSTEGTIPYGKRPLSPLSMGTQMASSGILTPYGKRPDSEKRKPVIYDLYCGTGTITQVLSDFASKMVGIEIVPEAIEAARLNARENHISNCVFISGDVMKVISEDGRIAPRPDIIILDPPREGVRPPALKKIIDYGVDYIIYISCKAESLARDLIPLQSAGYKVLNICPVDMFPQTDHVETVVGLQRRNT